MSGKVDGDSEDDEATDEPLDIFQEPQGYFKPKQSFTFTTFELLDGRSIPLRLVGESPLWAHHLWNGAKIVSDYLQQQAPTLVKGRTILELGAGAGLPSLVCAILGAKHVLVTDYPDPEVIENLQYNISHCPHLQISGQANIAAVGYLWGADVQPLLQSLPPNSKDPFQRFDILILADILYNHSEHRKLVRTIRTTLARSADARALVFFTPYRPWLLDRDLAFFDIVKAGDGTREGDVKVVEEVNAGVLGVERIFEQVMPKAMFENDRGDEALRRTVFGYEIFWADLRV